MEEKIRVLESKYPDLFITKTCSGTHQVCDGCGRDGFVLASGNTQEEAVNKAYERVA